MTFKQLGIKDSYIQGLSELGIKTPTEIQEQAIPVLLNNTTDFIGLAQTGTGKTAAFGLPVLNKIDASQPLVQALILSPTRELVQQIKKQLFKFTKYVDEKIFVEAVFGGEKIDKQINNLRRPTHIIVATPGRLIDLIEQKAVNLRSIQTVVLDEADEMLSMGFKQELNKILDYTNGNRKTWLFSATFPEEIRRIVKTYMKGDIARVEVNKNALVNANISHQYKITSLADKFNNLRRPTHIIVATPGRLIDLIEQKAVNLRSIQTVVLDEADEMLSMGFKQELNKILDYTNGNRKTWLFSATFPEEIRRIVKTYMKGDIARVEVNKNALVNANISHQYKITSLADKFNNLIGILEDRAEERGIIFCRTKLGVQKLTNELQEEGFSVGALEGDMQQKERDKVMRAFKNETIQYMVSTDVSARGIDVKDLGFILHHQLPEKMEYYTHRSGRTARAGKKGHSIALVLHSEMQQIYDIQKKLGIQFEEI